MGKPSRKSPEVQAYLRALGNPYASSQMFDEERPVVVARSKFYLGENPYAKLVLGENDHTSNDLVPTRLPSLEPAQPKNWTLSKTEFRARAKCIFEQYIPALEKGKLRIHHRDFITRNETCSPHKRFRLIKALQKYDISAMQGVIPQFNRERDSLTESKLKEVERLADDET